MIDAANLVPGAIYQHAVLNSEIRYFSDIFRYAVLHELGGWWLDTDIVLVKPAVAYLDVIARVLTGMARARGVDLAEIETTVSAKLAWDDETHHHLSDASLHAVIASPAREADVRKLVDDAGRHCPVCQAISGSVALHVTADVIPV